MPRIWTADVMLDSWPDGSDRYALGEINGSRVGFACYLHLGIQEQVAEEIARKPVVAVAPARLPRRHRPP